MNIQENVVLNEKTTMKNSCITRYYAEIEKQEELLEIFSFIEKEELPFAILGGGSNMIFPKEFDGVVIHMNVSGTEETDTLFIGCAGEEWDSFVEKSIKKKICHIENLSGIPGTVGATPIQNIGAYGVEVSEMIEWVEVFNIHTRQFEKLSNNKCCFGYRDSFFKKSEGKKYIVTRVAYRKSDVCHVAIAYKDLTHYFETTKKVTPAMVRTAVLAIRKEKFPDYNNYGTCGSFFKNPIVSEEIASRLQEKYGDIPLFPLGDEKIKIPLAWILDHVCHLKGYREGNVFLYEKQPLILVAEKNTFTEEIENFSKKITNIVFEKTNIQIEKEVVFIK